MEKATRCLRRIFELAPTKKRNYILDQVNDVSFSGSNTALCFMCASVTS
jgi:hypothetical protein